MMETVFTVGPPRGYITRIPVYDIATRICYRKRHLNGGKQNKQCEVTLQRIGSIAKFFLKRYGPGASTDISGPLGLKFLPLEKASAVADCLENQFTPHDFCDENHE
jgi:hypothetical protein